jgi:hypothetical protein
MLFRETLILCWLTLTSPNQKSNTTTSILAKAKETLAEKNLLLFMADAMGSTPSLPFAILTNEDDMEFRVNVRCNMAKAVSAPNPMPKPEKKAALNVAERNDHLNMLPININTKHSISNQTSAMIKPKTIFCSLLKLSMRPPYL